jgi:hypothetical protein
MPAWFVPLLATGALAAIVTAVVATMGWRHLQQQIARPVAPTVEETPQASTSFPEPPPAAAEAAPAPVEVLEPAMLVSTVEAEAEPPQENKNRIVQFHVLGRSAMGSSYQVMILTQEGRIFLGRTGEVEDRGQCGHFTPVDVGPDFTPAGG